MLDRVSPTPTIGVKDLKVAKEFYQNKLGLNLVGDEDDGDCVQFYRSGNGTIEIYKSNFAGTNKTTAMTWAMGDDFETEVESLRKKGVEFEHYNMPDTTLDGDIHVMKDMKAAWFKDPDGNILCLHDH